MRTDRSCHCSTYPDADAVRRRFARISAGHVEELGTGTNRRRGRSRAEGQASRGRPRDRHGRVRHPRLAPRLRRSAVGTRRAMVHELRVDRAVHLRAAAERRMLVARAARRRRRQERKAGAQGSERAPTGARSESTLEAASPRFGPQRVGGRDVRDAVHEFDELDDCDSSLEIRQRGRGAVVAG